MNSAVTSLAIVIVAMAIGVCTISIANLVFYAGDVDPQASRQTTS
jgi:hypothetical protein